MERFSNGDGAVFALLRTQLIRVTARCGAPAHEREDCVQEAWFALLVRHRDWPLDDPRTWRWLQRVARNKAIDAHRRGRRGLKSLDREVRTPSAFIGPDRPDDLDLDSEPTHALALGRVADALEKLAEVDRAIFIQHAQGGTTFAEIGQDLGLTPGQARARYNRALHRIRSWLGVQSTNASIDWGGGRRSVSPNHITGRTDAHAGIGRIS